MDAMKSIFIKLIKHGINPEQQQKDLGNISLSIKEQKELYSLSKKHDVSHLIAIVGKEYNLFTATEVSQRFERDYLTSIMRYEQINYEYQEIVELFKCKNIQFVPLKGAVLREYYSEPWHRTSCDIDLLIHEEDLENATKNLIELKGYKRDGKTNYHDVSLYSPSNVHLELHFNILENIKSIDKLLAQVWNYCVLKEDGTFEYRQINEYLVFHLLAHLLYHFLRGGCGVRSIIDIWLVHQKMDINQTILREMLKACGIVLFYERILELANAWFCNQESSIIIEKMGNYIFNGGVYGNFENKMQVVSANVENKKNYIRKRIFCPYETMKHRYPILKKHKWLLPFYEVARWLETIFKGKAKNLKQEVEAIDFNLDKKNDFKNFLQDIGLEGVE